MDPDMLKEIHDNKTISSHAQNYICTIHNFPNYVQNIFEFDRDRFLKKASIY
jgi:hypothetical protein